ncbi:MAG: glycosyltransferase family 2 protein [Pseudomonadota bacterium]
MIALLTIVSSIIALAALLPALVLFAEVLASLAPVRRFTPGSENPSLAVLIPAHNEGAHLLPTLRDLSAAAEAGARVIVVADNCTDDTAEVAKNAGADVLIRHDPERRGKGYALQYAIDALRSASPEIVLFLDADARFAPDAPFALARLSASQGRPVQARYDMAPADDAGPVGAVAAFAWVFINLVRMRGLASIAGVTRFTGVGLAAPWSTLEGLDFGSGALTEDHGLTFALAERRAAPRFAPWIRVESAFPQKQSAMVTQRARWEHGSLGVLTRLAPRALARAIREKNMQLGAIALDAMTPPLAAYAVFLTAAVMVSAVTALVGPAAPLAIVVTAGGLFALSVVIGWAAFGRRILPAHALPGVFSFLAAKLKIYGRSGRDSAKRWTRTERD